MTARGKEAPRRTHFYLVILLFVASVAISISTAIIYLNSLEAADEALRLQALGVAASVEAALDDIRGKEKLFAEINTSAAWEGIAYIALYDRNGKTLLHSNAALIGRVFDLPDVKKASDEGKPVFGYIKLMTDEEVFVMNYPIVVGESVNVLRIALHPYPAQDIVRQAKYQAIIVAVILILLWIVGFFLIKAVRKSEKLTDLMAEKERLAAIGEMAAALAHEIRNPLGSIKGFAQYMAETRGDEGLKIIINEAARLERLTEDLLMYSRPAAPRMEEFDLADLVGEIELHAKASELFKNKHIQFKISISEGLKITTDRGMLWRALANIIRNSMEAVDKNGVIEISADRENGFVNISVSDNGCGMDEETLRRAFKSFFTTKAKGSGLGLAIVESLVKTLGGRIEARSGVGRGTTIKISLPEKPEG